MIAFKENHKPGRRKTLAIHISCINNHKKRTESIPRFLSSLGKLVQSRWNLQLLLQNPPLPLNLNSLREFHEPGQIPLWRSVLPISNCFGRFLNKGFTTFSCKTTELAKKRWGLRAKTVALKT